MLRTDFLLTLRLALPLIVAEVGWMSMGIVDTIMVGRSPDSAIAIGATGLGQSLYHSVAIFGGGLLLGLDTFVAHAYGREGFTYVPTVTCERIASRIRAYPGADVCGVILAGDDVTVRNQRGTGGTDAAVSALAPEWGTLPLLAHF